MTKYEIINSLDSISSSNSYSKRGFSFEKTIQYRSLKTLIKKLKHPIKIPKLSFLDIFRSKYPYASTTLEFQDENFSATLYNNFNNEKKNEEINSMIQGKNQNNNFINKKKISKQNLDYFNSDPFKYNPNYNSIYRNVPKVKFFLPSKEFLTAKNKKIKEIDNINKDNNIENYIENKIKINKINKNNKRQLLLPIIITLKI